MAALASAPAAVAGPERCIPAGCAASSDLNARPKWCVQVLIAVADTPGHGDAIPSSLPVQRIGLLAVTCGGAALSSRAADWQPLWLLATLAVLGVLGDRVHARTGRLRLSAGLTIVGLAMALLGPAPAVAICFASRIVDAIWTDGMRLRRPPARAGLEPRDVRRRAAREPGDPRCAARGGLAAASAAFALVVVAAIGLANVINFMLAATWIRVHAGTPIGTQLRRDFLPSLSWITAPNFVAGALVTLYYPRWPDVPAARARAVGGVLRAAGGAAQLSAAPRRARAAHD